ncbi:Protein of unknown function (DUF1679) [Phytophthora boehmeriae]|uniref:3'(2'),5'-bisphosphate nucleotidase 1 n=1 Tax=Phytophthora boehmeriae TaxID=109152 RepID=A0A8T1X402_9STRA|nr:Protein of unknown function (DUF1679) [Phytophthora boehmeriae]
MTVAAPSSPPPMLQPLLSACFSASVHGGRVIRQVVQQHVALDMVNKTDGQYDPQTVADRRSQQRIITALREAFPQLQIVGEEGELAPPEPEDVVQCDLHALDAVAFKGGEEVKNQVLEWNDLVLWVDPLDGTKRFAAKKFDEVSVLIGITYKQRPIAGVVHLPFHGQHGVTFWGGPGIGVFRSDHDVTDANTVHSKWAKPSPLFPQRPLICTVSSTDCELVNSAMHQLSPATILTGGATGTMVLGVITGDSDAFFRFKAATRKWDICAVEPLIEALGGKITDTQGHVYVYDHIGNAPDFDNERGLLACIESDAMQTVLGVMTKVNLTSALDGREMTPQWFQECVFPRGRVSQVHVVPDSVHRGKHSAVAKLQSANLFFESESRKVVAFDWQWSGVGLGAMDVANLLNTSVSISLLVTDENELELLRFYYESLAERLEALGVTPELQTIYSFEAFERHYMLATLEYARLLISNFWKKMTPESCKAKANNANCGLGYRSIPHVVRMVRKLHEGLIRVKQEH